MRLFRGKKGLTESQMQKIVNFCKPRVLMDGPGLLQDWIRSRTMQYALNEVSDEMKEGLEVYELLIGRPFKPNTFLHRSLDERYVQALSSRFGSRRRLAAYVRKTPKLMLHAAYAAWIFKMIPKRRLQAVIDSHKVAVHKAPFKKISKRKKRGP